METGATQEMAQAAALPMPQGPETRVGAVVLLAAPQRYLKTADPMPMLRPPDLIDPEEQGQVVEVRPRGLLAVRFRRGTFLLTAQDLRPLPGT